jgi:hypothetical protein
MTEVNRTEDERSQAIDIANRILDEPLCDPDDDLRVLSRQLIRRSEELDYVYRCITGGFRQGVFDFSQVKDRAFQYTGIPKP